MCGIIGYLGHRDKKDIIINGLKKMEYRGYDSSGMAVLNESQYEKYRSVGKIEGLEKKIVNTNLKGHLGIGHTRWATHGEPSETNAHPHEVNGVMLIANGIIENYLDLKTKILDRDGRIQSETDTELVAHLISHEISLGLSFKEAVEKAIRQLEGVYTLLISYEKAPDTLIAVKNGPPLIVGVGDNEMIVASDLQAIVPYTKKVIYLEDNELALIKRNSLEIFNDKGELLNRSYIEIDWTQEIAEKKGYKHFMLKEIFEQPQSIDQSIHQYVNRVDLTVRMDNLQEGYKAINNKFLGEISRIQIVACGTSYYAGLIGEYYIEKISKISVEVELASEFRYRDPILEPHTLVLVISQSGETADTLAALKLAKNNHIPVLSLCNVKNSSIDRESDGQLYMNCGLEVGVASTKTMTTTIADLLLFAIYLSKLHKKISGDEESQMVDNLLKAPRLIEEILTYDSYFNKVSSSLQQSKGLLYIGRGVNYPVALEGALKLKELAYVHSEGYAAGEMKHGPIALVDPHMSVVVVAPKDTVYEKTVSNLQEVKARGGRIISIGSKGDSHLEKMSEHFIALPHVQWYLTPLLTLIPLQLIAYHMANILGRDVDKPRNLAKSVTVE